MKGVFYKMITRPKHFTVVSATAEARHALTAFDAALLKAGIGNVNLVRLSSILPQGCKENKGGISFTPGAFVPVVYSAVNSDEEGELIAAAVGIGFSEDSFGVIMEHSGSCSAETARGKVEEMIKEAFDYRSLKLKGIRVKSVEHKVGVCGAAVAAVVFW